MTILYALLVLLVAMLVTTITSLFDLTVKLFTLIVKNINLRGSPVLCDILAMTDKHIFCDTESVSRHIQFL